MSDFYFLNPELNVNCTNLDLGIAYCVEPVGNIQTYPGYTVSSGAPTITVPPATFASVNTAITTPTPITTIIYAPSNLPTAPGTLSNCYAYQNYNASLANECLYVASLYDVTTDQLLEWNPSLNSNMSECSLQPGYSYCAALTNATGRCLVANVTDVQADIP